MKEERRKKKLIKNKPFSTVLFCPPSPGSHLAKELRMIVEEETRGKGWTVGYVEFSKMVFSTVVTHIPM